MILMMSSVITVYCHEDDCECVWCDDCFEHEDDCECGTNVD
jgi:hypothetical protein